jgi:hypothetical protein
VRTGAEIKVALDAFVTRWSGYAGTERAEAQTFLNDLFACYGSDRKDVGARFEEFKTSSGFMDLFWPEVLIVEMKHPKQPLERAADQRERYWRESADQAAGIGAARYVLACNFHDFELWEPGRFPGTPLATFTLEELPDRYDLLQFLSDPSRQAVVLEHRRELTTEAARHIAQLYESLKDRSAAPVDEIQRFTMQAVWCFFAEDLGMLDGYPLQSIVNDLLTQAHPDSARDIGYLFTLLNQKTNRNRTGLYAGTRYVNGDLFTKPAMVALNRDELLHLKDAAEFDWQAVDPTIFGSLLEGVLGQERRWELGAHYTHEVDILKIVVPTIVRPWRERIDATTTPQQARDLLDELCAFRVLDPACGSGNFLYVAYRELRALEVMLKQRIGALARQTGAPMPTGRLPYYPLTNLHGIDIERAAVLIARVTLWMGHRQMIEQFGEAEPPLPLVDLPAIRSADALRVAWPEVDAIIGNPPFLGSQHVRAALGEQYLDWLKEEFGVGVKDICTYWFRRAQDHLKPGQRAGLVGTNSVAQNRARGASLEYIATNGGVITDAVSSQKWPGDAKVHVSLVNWVKQPAEQPTAYSLDGEEVAGITTSLRGAVAGGCVPVPLAANKGKCFQGPIPVGGGFIIDEDEAHALLARDEADYTEVVRPYLIGEDIADGVEQTPSRWIIDFAQRPLEESSRYTAALAIVRQRVKPFRETVQRRARRERWWLFGENATGMRRALAPLSRFVAGTATGKRLLLAWEPPEVCPSNLNNVFAFDDDYSMGILLSRAHDAWAWARSSTLETRLRYTPSSAFETFPFPDPVSGEARARVAAASSALYARRSELCLEHNIGLTRLYNLMDEGGFTDLKALHLALDRAVAAAYGWPEQVAQDGPELVRLLTERNREIAEAGRPYDPFGTG